MIQLVDKALEQFLRERVPLSERAADISFQPPDRTWGAGLTRPTVNAFLWDVCRSNSRSRAGMQQRVAPGGAIERRPANPVVELHYLMTAWASELRDEHQLLGTVMECIVSHPSLPGDFLPPELADAKCGMALAAPEHRVPGDFWSALGGTLKPGLQVQISLPVEVFTWRPTATPASEISLNVDELARPAPPATTLPPDDQISTTRRRGSNGALVMEGRAPQPNVPPGS